MSSLDVAKLVIGYLSEQGFERTKSAFYQECSAIQQTGAMDADSVVDGQKLSLIIEEYLVLKGRDKKPNKDPESVLKLLWKQFDNLVGQLKYSSFRSVKLDNPEMAMCQGARVRAMNRQQRDRYRKNMINARNIAPRNSGVSVAVLSSSHTDPGPGPVISLQPPRAEATTPSKPTQLVLIPSPQTTPTTQNSAKRLPIPLSPSPIKIAPNASRHGSLKSPTQQHNMTTRTKTKNPPPQRTTINTVIPSHPLVTLPPSANSTPMPVPRSHMPPPLLPDSSTVLPQHTNLTPLSRDSNIPLHPHNVPPSPVSNIVLPSHPHMPPPSLPPLLPAKNTVQTTGTRAMLSNNLFTQIVQEPCSLPEKDYAMNISMAPLAVDDNLKSPKRKSAPPKRRPLITDSTPSEPARTVESPVKPAATSLVPLDELHPDVASFVEKILEQPELSEKLAENINRGVELNIPSSQTETVAESSSSSSILDSEKVDNIMEMMVADPAFEQLFSNFESFTNSCDENEFNMDQDMLCPLLSEHTTVKDTEISLRNASLATDALLLLANSPAKLPSKSPQSTSPSTSNSLQTPQKNLFSPHTGSKLHVSALSTPSTFPDMQQGRCPGAPSGDQLDAHSHIRQLNFTGSPTNKRVRVPNTVLEERSASHSTGSPTNLVLAAGTVQDCPTASQLQTTEVPSNRALVTETVRDCPTASQLQTTEVPSNRALVTETVRDCPTASQLQTTEVPSNRALVTETVRDCLGSRQSQTTVSPNNHVLASETTQDCLASRSNGNHPFTSCLSLQGMTQKEDAEVPRLVEKDRSPEKSSTATKDSVSLGKTSQLGKNTIEGCSRNLVGGDSRDLNVVGYKSITRCREMNEENKDSSEMKDKGGPGAESEEEGEQDNRKMIEEKGKETSMKEREEKDKKEDENVVGNEEDENDSGKKQKKGKGRNFEEMGESSKEGEKKENGNGMENKEKEGMEYKVKQNISFASENEESSLTVLEELATIAFSRSPNKVVGIAEDARQVLVINEDNVGDAGQEFSDKPGSPNSEQVGTGTAPPCSSGECRSCEKDRNEATITQDGDDNKRMEEKEKRMNLKEMGESSRQRDEEVDDGCKMENKEKEDGIMNNGKRLEEEGNGGNLKEIDEHRKEEDNKEDDRNKMKSDEMEDENGKRMEENMKGRWDKEKDWNGMENKQASDERNGALGSEPNSQNREDSKNEQEDESSKEVGQKTPLSQLKDSRSGSTQVLKRKFKKNKRSSGSSKKRRTLPMDLDVDKFLSRLHYAEENTTDIKNPTE